MNIKSLNFEQLNEIYNTRMKIDFPPSELRPFSSMEYLTEQGLYRAFAYGDDVTTLGYALFAENKSAALLDYFAVDANCRGQGIGGKFLSGIRAMAGEFTAPYVLIEVESVESAQTQEQIDERERRIRFYKHCGCVPTGVFSFLFGVEYQILILPLAEACEPDDTEVFSSLMSVYRMIVPPLVGSDEESFNEVCRCYYGSAHGQNDFARQLGRSVTYMYRNRSKFMNEHLREYGLSGAMYMIMLHIGLHPGTTQDSIATHMYIDKSNVARRIKQLEELGYLRRETDAADRRQNNLYLTQDGAKMLPIIKQNLSQWGHGIADGLSSDELDTLLALLGKITGE